MTEKEVNQLQVEIESGTLTDPDTEREWTEAQLTATRKEEQQMIFSFRLFKALRDDQRMTEAAKTLRNIRAAIEHLSARMKVLGDA